MKSIRFSLIMLVLAAGVLVACHLHWMSLLPERVAIHFDAAGRANGWMSRAQHGWSSPLIHLGATAFIIGLSALMHLMPPAVMNCPHADYWRQPAHYPDACAFVREWSRWLAAVMLIWGTLMDRQIVLANLSQPPRLDSSATWVLSACFLVAVVVAVLLLLLKFLRKPVGIGSSADPGRLPSAKTPQ